MIVTVGTGGVGINSQSAATPEAGYFATFEGSNANPTFGFLKVNVSSTSLSAQLRPRRGRNLYGLLHDPVDTRSHGVKGRTPSLRPASTVRYVRSPTHQVHAVKS